MEMLSTVAQVIITAALARSDSAVRWARQRIPTDHQSIRTGWYSTGLDNVDRTYVIARCAPSRRREFNETDLDVARTFATHALGGRVPSFAVVTGDGIHLEASSRTAGGPDAHCWLWNNGLIELCLPIGVPIEPERPITIPAGEVAEVLLLLSRAIHDGWYRRLYRGSRRVRLDWMLAVSRGVSDVNGTRYWEEITFPGRRPADRGDRAYPPSPPRVLQDALRAQPQRTPPTKIAEAALREFVHASAYRKYDDAIRDSLDVGVARIAMAERLGAISASQENQRVG